MSKDRITTPPINNQPAIFESKHNLPSKNRLAIGIQARTVVFPYISLYNLLNNIANIKYGMIAIIRLEKFENIFSIFIPPIICIITILLYLSNKSLLI